MPRVFTLADWCVLGGYIVAVSCIGALFYRRNSTASEYFLGGRKMHAIPVAISLVAADLSAITYMGVPAWSYSHNFELFWSTFVYLPAAPVVMYLFMPFYARFKMFTGYEYLERRFGLPARLTGAFFFLLIRGAHVAIVIYAPSLILSMLTQVPLTACIFIIGAITTVYTALGGMKAVIWTDVMQFTILVAGIVTVFWLALRRIPGGWHSLYSVASAAGKLQIVNWTFDPNSLTATWPVLLGGGVLVLSSMATDQAYLQRYFTTGSLGEGRRSILLDAILIVPIILLLYVLGVVLFVYYHYHPDRAAGLLNTDQVLPNFVIRELPGALSGLVIASIFASSMAVMSASINSLTTVTTVDFYQRWIRRNDPSTNLVLSGRVGTVAWGAIGTVAAMLADRLGPLASSFSLISSYLAGPILGIFLLGMVTRRAKQGGALAGSMAGFFAVLWVAKTSKISFFYYSVIGLLVTCLSGYALSILQRSRMAADHISFSLGLDERVVHFVREMFTPPVSK